MVVKVPPNVIEDALKQAPQAYTLAALDSSLDLPLDGNHVYVGTDGCAVEIIDISTGERCRSCLQDVADIARVADYTEEIAFHWVPVSAQDCPPESRGLHELMAIWKNSTKHVQTESVYSKKRSSGGCGDGFRPCRRSGSTPQKTESFSYGMHNFSACPGWR